MHQHHLDDEPTVGSLDGDNLQLPAPLVDADPSDDEGLRDLVGLDAGRGGFDDMTGAGPAYPVLAAAAREPDRLRLRTSIASYTTSMSDVPVADRLASLGRVDLRVVYRGVLLPSTLTENRQLDSRLAN